MLKIFENSWPSASNFNIFSRSIVQFFLTVGQNNFGNKIPILRKLPNSNQDWSNIKRVSLDLILDIRRSNLLTEFQKIPHSTLVIPYYLASDGQDCLTKIFCINLGSLINLAYWPLLAPSGLFGLLWPLFGLYP